MDVSSPCWSLIWCQCWRCPNSSLQWLGHLWGAENHGQQGVQGTGDYISISGQFIFEENNRGIVCSQLTIASDSIVICPPNYLSIYPSIHPSCFQMEERISMSLRYFSAKLTTAFVRPTAQVQQLRGLLRELSLLIWFIWRIRFEKAVPHLNWLRTRWHDFRRQKTVCSLHQRCWEEQVQRTGIRTHCCVFALSQHTLHKHRSKVNDAFTEFSLVT